MISRRAYSQALSELLDGSGVGLGLLAFLVLGRAFFLDVETQVLQEDAASGVPRSGPALP